MRGERVAQGVATGVLLDARLGDGFFHSALEDFLADVVAARFAGAGVGGERLGREDPLPGPFASGVGVLAVQGVRQVDIGLPGVAVLFIEGVDFSEVAHQGVFEGLGEHGEAVFLALAVSDGDLVQGQVHVFDAQADTIHEPQSGAVKEACHQVRCAVQVSEECLDFGAGEDDGEALGAFGGGDAIEGKGVKAEDFFVDEEEGIAGDVLCGGADVLFDGEVGEVGADFGVSEGSGVGLSVEEEEALDGGEISLLGADTEVFKSDDLSDLIEKVVEFGVAIGVEFVVHGIALVPGATYS